MLMVMRWMCERVCGMEFDGGWRGVEGIVSVCESGNFGGLEVGFRV